MSSEQATTVGGLVALLERRFPLAWAEEWDRVGLVVGDRLAPLQGVVVTLDATAEAVERAAGHSANVLVTHHPPFLTVPEAVAAGPGASGALEAALRLGVAIVCLHTNLDRSPAGASALAEALGLSVVAPLESATEKIFHVVTFVPENAVSSVSDAMFAAGAGRVGEYDGCSYHSEGTGTFTPREGANPVISGSDTGVPEIRLEMVAPPLTVDGVLAAARDAHPYEEPVVLAVEGVRARGAARLGRVCSWVDGATLGDLAGHVARTLGVACRVWGDEARPVHTIAVANGSAGSLMRDAAAAADTLIAGEVRYHDALAATASGLAVIEAGHDSTEWPLVAVLAGAVRAGVGHSVDVFEEAASPGWWTMEVAHVRR